MRALPTSQARGAEGFIAHAAPADSEALTVTELRHAAGDRQRPFDAHAGPTVPDEPPAAAIELRNTILR